MENVFKLIDKIAIIIKVSCFDGKIKKLVYDDIILSLEDMKDELNKFTITAPTSSKSFSNMEKFVNNHINYADSQIMLEELRIRGFNVDNVKKEDQRMTEMDEIKLAAYNSCKRHMRVLGKGKDILSFTEWEKKACEQLK